MRSALVTGLLVGLWAGAVHADCYSRDGVLAKNSAYYDKDFEMVSCGNGTNTCCFQGDKCGTNLLCMNGEGTPTRQYCAVSNWDGCSTMCADVKATGTLLVDCGKNMYCCGAVDASCCNDDTEHFFVDPDNGEVKAPSKATGASASASPTWWTVDSKALLAATSMSSSSSTASASVTQSSASEATGSTGSTTTSATETGATSSPTNTAPPAGEGESKGLSAGAGAGIGIGAAAAIALVGGLIWFLMKRKKKDNPYEAPADQHTAGAGQYSPTSYPSEHKPHNNYYAHESAPTGQVHNSAVAPQELDGSAMVPEMQGDSQRHMMR